MTQGVFKQVEGRRDYDPTFGVISYDGSFVGHDHILITQSVKVVVQSRD